MSSSIDETFGAAYIGIVVAALLGIYKTSSVFQGVYDFTHQKDGWVLRGLIYIYVAIVLVFDFVHQALITHTGIILNICYAYISNHIPATAREA
ncbi:MAG: hypothetical protein NXY57DRAFT_968468 [Lentinula lateritia]|nr:MAG: hypothetical protein NXY57DRAFT_968468 [Lentinula lateritia]